MATAIIRAKLTGDGSEFTGMVNQAMRGVTELKSAVGGFSGALGNMLSVAGLIAFGKETLADAAHLYDLAHTLGISTTEMQRIGFAAKQLGAEQEEVVKAILKVQTALATGSSEGVEYARALKDIGLESDQLKNIPVDEFLLRVADGFSKTENRATANGAAAALFGGRLLHLLPILEQGREGLADFFDATTVRAPEAIKQAKLLSQEFEHVWEAIKKLGLSGTLTISNPFIQSGGRMFAALEYLASYYQGTDEGTAYEVLLKRLQETNVLSGALTLPEGEADKMRDRLAGLRAEIAKIKQEAKDAGSLQNIPAQRRFELTNYEDAAAAIERTLRLFKEPLSKGGTTGAPEFESQAEQQTQKEINRLIEERDRLLARAAELSSTDLENLQEYQRQLADLIAHGPKRQGGATVIATADDAKNLRDQAQVQERIASIRAKMDKDALTAKEQLGRIEEDIAEKQFRTNLQSMTHAQKINALRERQAWFSNAATALEWSASDDWTTQKAAEFRKRAAELGLEIAQEQHAPRGAGRGTQIFAGPIESIGARSAPVFAQARDASLLVLNKQAEKLEGIRSGVQSANTHLEHIERQGRNS